MAKLLTDETVRNLIAQHIRQQGGVRAAARHLNVSPGAISESVRGKNPLSKSLLAALRLRRVSALYERIP